MGHEDENKKQSNKEMTYTIQFLKHRLRQHLAVGGLRVYLAALYILIYIFM